MHSLPTLADQNRLLFALPPIIRERLLSETEVVHLPQGKILCELGDSMRFIYFPISGMASLISTTEAGETVEIAVVGNEGLVGAAVILGGNVAPYQISIQISMDALKIKTDVLKKEFDENKLLQRMLLRYLHTLLAQIAQAAACNRFHSVEKRLCRWLLVAQDRVKSNTIKLTHEIIGHMLGTHRTGVTMAALSLQDAGIISYRRGKITILNQKRLEESACECHRSLNYELNNSLII